MADPRVADLGSPLSYRVEVTAGDDAGGEAGTP
jgi:hypothetical protein